MLITIGILVAIGAAVALAALTLDRPTRPPPPKPLDEEWSGCGDGPDTAD
jgi:hypothetical protein